MLLHQKSKRVVYTSYTRNLFEVDYEKPWVLDEEHWLLVDQLNEG